jgi:hypothetical protein
MQLHDVHIAGRERPIAVSMSLRQDDDGHVTVGEQRAVDADGLAAPGPKEPDLDVVADASKLYRQLDDDAEHPGIVVRAGGDYLSDAHEHRSTTWAAVPRRSRGMGGSATGDAFAKQAPTSSNSFGSHTPEGIEQVRSDRGILIGP